MKRIIGFVLVLALLLSTFTFAFTLARSVQYPSSMCISELDYDGSSLEWVDSTPAIIRCLWQ